jgi:hypothetical protein
MDRGAYPAVGGLPTVTLDIGEPQDFRFHLRQQCKQAGVGRDLGARDRRVGLRRPHDLHEVPAARERRQQVHAHQRSEILVTFRGKVLR